MYGLKRNDAISSTLCCTFMTLSPWHYYQISSFHRVILLLNSNGSTRPRWHISVNEIKKPVLFQRRFCQASQVDRRKKKKQTRKTFFENTQQRATLTSNQVSTQKLNCSIDTDSSEEKELFVPPASCKIKDSVFWQHHFLSLCSWFWH